MIQMIADNKSDNWIDEGIDDIHKDHDSGDDQFADFVDNSVQGGDYVVDYITVHSGAKDEANFMRHLRQSVRVHKYPNILKRFFLGSVKNTYYDYRIYCLNCHKMYSNLFMLYLYDDYEDKTILKQDITVFDLLLVAMPHEQIPISIMNKAATDNAAIDQLSSKNGFLMLREGHHRYSNEIYIDLRNYNWYFNRITRENIVLKESNKICPYCGAPTTDALKGPLFLEQLFNVDMLYSKKAWKYSNMNKSVLDGLPHSHARIKEKLKDQVRNYLEINGVKYNRDRDKGDDIHDIIQIVNLIKLNLWNTLYVCLGTFTELYKVRNDRNRPKITVLPGMRDEIYNIIKAEFYVGDFKNDILIFSPKNPADIECEFLRNAELLVKDKKLKKDLPLIKFQMDRFQIGSDVLVFKEDDDIFYIPVPKSFLDIQSRKDFMNLHRIILTWILYGQIFQFRQRANLLKNGMLRYETIAVPYNTPPKMEDWIQNEDLDGLNDGVVREIYGDL